MACTVLAGLLGLPGAVAQATLSGDVPDDGLEFFFVPFDVPEGTVEVEVRHDDLSAANILDFGLVDAAGQYRGWGGGNEEPAVVSLDAASRSYLPGPLPAGEWKVVVGKAKIVEPPGRYQIEIALRTTATLVAQPERAPYAAAAPLSTEPRWYAGDFHVHSRESGDASPTIDEVADFARGRGLDFVELSEHNTVSQLDFLVDAQARHPDLLFLPGMEWTTYHGHGNALGLTAWVDHKVGLPGVELAPTIEAIHAQGGLFAINHPVLDLGDNCIGCAWRWDLDPTLVDAVEIATGGWQQSGWLFGEDALAFWDALCDGGAHVTAIGGSDDHRAGAGTAATDSPIGSATTMVWATELSAAAIVQGIRDGRTVVKLQGPDDPMIDLTTDPARVGDTVTARRVVLRATVSGLQGGSTRARFVRNGTPLPGVNVDTDPFVLEAMFEAPATGQDRYRVEVLVGGNPRTIANHVWLAYGDAVPEHELEPPDAVEVVETQVDTGADASGAVDTQDDAADAPAAQGDEGCGCRLDGTRRGSFATLLLFALGLAWSVGRRRRRRLRGTA